MDHNKRDSLAEIAVDPVCGMDVEISTAEHRYDFNDNTVYFCSANCQNRFLADSAAYASNELAAETAYTCPMHPQIREKHPGSCPICKMTLELQRVNATVIDPVCGMDVEVATAEHCFDYGGAPMFFCSEVCRTKFVADPSAYAHPREERVAPAIAISSKTYTCPMPARVDASAWRPLGMHGSHSFNIDFSGLTLRPSDLIGTPGDYER